MIGRPRATDGAQVNTGTVRYQTDTVRDTSGTKDDPDTSANTHGNGVDPAASPAQTNGAAAGARPIGPPNPADQADTYPRVF